MKGWHTIREASRPENLNRCEPWIRAGIRSGLIQIERIGNLTVIADAEIKRLRKNMPVIRREAY